MDSCNDNSSLAYNNRLGKAVITVRKRKYADKIFFLIV